MRMMTRLKEPRFQMSWMQRLEPCNKYAWSPQHSSSLDGSKRMRCTTTRRQEVDPDEHPHTAVLAQKGNVTRLNHRSRNTECQYKEQRNGSTAEDTKQRWNFITPSWIAASCLCTRMQATNNSLPLFADVSLQLIPTDVNSSISLASSQNSSDFKTRSSFPSAPHPVADIASAPHFIDIVPFVTWLVCRKRTAVLDSKRVHMQALDDCVQYFQV